MTRRRSAAGRSSQHRPRSVRMSPLLGRRLVLDATAVDALRSQRQTDLLRAAVLLAIAAADAGVTVPTSVRVEAAWDRRSSGWTGADRFAREDHLLDPTVADLAAGTHDPAPATTRRPSVADRHGAVAAHRQSARPGVSVVEVLTADVTDIRAVLDRLPTLERPIDVRRLEPHTTS